MAIPGASLKIILSKSVFNSIVMVNITHPEKAKNKVWQLPLYDDGGHNDGAPNDGIYGNMFYI